MEACTEPLSCEMSPTCPCPSCLGAWISSAPVSRVSQLAELGGEGGLATNGGSGPLLEVPWGRFDPHSSSWKTSQTSLALGLEKSRVTLPASATMRSGACWARRTLEAHTSVNAGGAWPTPLASDGSRGDRQADGKRGMSLVETSKMFAAGLWPTVTVCGNGNRVGASPKSGNGLGTAAAIFVTGTWGTPRASDSREGADGTAPINGYLGRQTVAWAHATPGDLLIRAGMTLENVGPLSPLFAEWVLGWPIGHTELRPLETESTLWWRQQLMDCLAVALGFGESRDRQ
jgi:hypothetical protein